MELRPLRLRPQTPPASFGMFGKRTETYVLLNGHTWGADVICIGNVHTCVYVSSLCPFLFDLFRFVELSRVELSCVVLSWVVFQCDSALTCKFVVMISFGEYSCFIPSTWNRHGLALACMNAWAPIHLPISQQLVPILPPKDDTRLIDFCIHARKHQYGTWKML